MHQLDDAERGRGEAVTPVRVVISNLRQGTFERPKQIPFRVLRLNAGDRKIALSMKEAAPAPPPSLPEPVAPKVKEPERLSTMAEALSSAGITFTS